MKYRTGDHVPEGERKPSIHVRIGRSVDVKTTTENLRRAAAALGPHDVWGIRTALARDERTLKRRQAMIYVSAVGFWVFLVLLLWTLEAVP